MTRRAAWLVLCITLGQAACHKEHPLEPQVLPPDGAIAVDFRTDQQQYRIGASAKTTMVNRSPDTITMGVCSDALEREVTGGWAEILPNVAIACIALALIVPPGDSVTLSYNLILASTPGTYRVRRQFSVQHGTSSEGMYRRTNTFTVVR